MSLFATALQTVEISSTKTRLGISTYISNSAEKVEKLLKSQHFSCILFEVKREEYYSQVFSPMPGRFLYACSAQLLLALSALCSSL